MRKDTHPLEVDLLTLFRCFLCDSQVYVQHLVRAAKMPPQRIVAVRCMGRLLAAVPHFNFREALLAAVVPRMDAADDEIR